MLKVHPVNPGTYISRYSKIDLREFFLISDKQTSGLHVSILFLTPPMLQTSDFERSDRYCHDKSDNYILIPRMPMPEDYQGVLLASAKSNVILFPFLCSRTLLHLIRTLHIIRTLVWYQRL